MAVREILLLGDPRLYELSRPCLREDGPELERIARDLRDTLADFRRRRGFGRAIAAPQIDEPVRMIFQEISEPLPMVNPVLTFLGDEKMTVWDDCMSFPDLLVKVERHRRIRLEYLDLGWERHEIELADDLSELLQHEYDHLDGILAVQRALDPKSFALASERRLLS